MSATNQDQGKSIIMIGRGRPGQARVILDKRHYPGRSGIIAALLQILSQIPLNQCQMVTIRPTKYNIIATIGDSKGHCEN